jgi:hypothetical protein
MKTISKLLCCFAVLLYVSCEKENQSPVSSGETNSDITFLAAANPANHGNHGNGNHGNHFGNGPTSQDSALAVQPFTIYPPLASDTIMFLQLQYITGTFATHNTITGGFTVNVSGNYDVDITALRDIPAEASNLMLFVNGSMIFDTGPVFGGTVSLQQSLNLNVADEVYVRTLDGGHALFPGGGFKLVRN